MRQAERLSEEIAAGLADGRLDRRLSAWWRWRDRDAVQRHEWAHAFGAAGPPPHVLVQAQRDTLARRNGHERFWGPSMQRMSPRRALGPAAVVRAAARTVASGRLSPSEAAGEVAGIVRREVAYHRARRRRTPSPAEKPTPPMRTLAEQAS
jgi:hypothetical protein